MTRGVGLSVMDKRHTEGNLVSTIGWQMGEDKKKEMKELKTGKPD